MFAADGKRPAVSDEILDQVFARKGAVEISNKFAGGIASVIVEGSAELRGNLFDGLVGLRAKLPGGTPVPAAVHEGEPAPKVRGGLALLRAELFAHAGANPGFRRALETGTDSTPVPADATPELRLAIDEHNRIIGPDPPADFGLGFSAPLRRALQGKADNMLHGYRWVGWAALVAAVAIVAVFYTWTPLTDRDDTQIATVVGLLGVGLYGGAQAIERLLEFTVGRWLFKDVPGREGDRVLVMLGIGVLLGTLVAAALHVGLLAQVSSQTPGDDWFGGADVIITGLAIGGGAKPIHDLLTQIKLSKLAT